MSRPTRPQRKRAVVELPENLSFDREERPSTFDEVLGNHINKESLKARLKAGKVPQFILFDGASGTGKTTLARILAREIRCETPVEGLACGKCKSCIITKNEYIKQAREINEVFEVNMSDRTGIDVIRELIEFASTRPRESKVKIAILDEVHQANVGAQNALLKLAEEPNSYFYLFLCTTNPEKLIEPLRTRLSMTITVKPPTIKELTDRLVEICKKRGINYNLDAIRLLVRKAKRTPRVCLKYLENVSSIGDVTLENVTMLLETISNEVWIELFEHINSRDMGRTLSFIEEISEEDISSKDILENLPKFMESVYDITYGVNRDLYTKEYSSKVRKIFKMDDFELLFISETIGGVRDTNNPRFALINLCGRLILRDTFIDNIRNKNNILQEENIQNEEKYTENYEKYKNEQVIEEFLEGVELIDAFKPIGLVESL